MDAENPDVVLNAEPLKRVLHNDHCPEVCAVVVNRVFGRNDRLRQELIEQLDQIIAASEKITQLEKEKIEFKGQMKNAEEALNKVSRDEKALEEKLEKAYKENEEKYQAKLLKNNAEYQTVKSELEARISTLEREKHELQIKAANVKNQLTEIQRQCEQLAEKNSQLEELLVKNEADIGEIDGPVDVITLQQQAGALEERELMLQAWEQEKEFQEKEIQRLREETRSLRHELKRPNPINKPEINKLKAQLIDSKGREDSLRGQLSNAIKEIAELRKKAHANKSAQMRRNTLNN